MQTIIGDWRNKDGSAVFTVLGLILVVTIVLGTMTRVGIHRSFMARKLADRVRAQAYAEAGANEAFTIIEQDWPGRTNAANFPLTSYGQGSYDVTIVDITNNVALIRSLGVCNDATVETILDIKNYGDSGSSWDMTAFDYAMICGGTLDFSGCGSISSTNGQVLMHSNNDMNIKGDAQTDISIESSTKIKISNNVTIDGDVAAPDLDYNPSKVTITGTAAVHSVPMVPIPDIDLTPYYNHASDNGEVHNGFSLSGGTYTPNGGILWVNGNVWISSSAVINGTIIATGDINFGGQASLAASDCGFALVSRDGDVKNTSTGTVEGLIYVKTGDYEHTANGNVEGQIIVNGDIKKAGNSDVLVFDQTIPTPPGGTPEGDIIGVSAWQK